MTTPPVAVDLSKAYRLLNHGPVTLITSAHGARRNVMAAAWTMPLDFKPPKILAVIDKSSYSRELVEASGEFALNLPARPQARATLAAGSSSGRGRDKIAEVGFRTFPASLIGAPLLTDCLGWLECRVMPEPRNEAGYDLFIAEVIAAWADPAAFSDGRWHFPDADRRTLHYSAGGGFFPTGDAFEVGGG